MDDLTQTRRVIVAITLFLIFLPGLIIISYDALTNIEGPNPFLVATVLIVGTPTVLIALLIYLFTDNKIKRKTTLIILLIAFQLSVLPLIWGINNIKLKFFLFNNEKELVLISNNLLDKRWTLEQAIDYTQSTNLPISLLGQIEEDETVLFFISGIIDNCHGIAYSRTGKEAKRNYCGTLINWKQLKDEWYEWGTT